MKKILKITLIAALALTALNGYAQKKRVTPEQKARIQTDSLTRELSLTEEQQKIVYDLRVSVEEGLARINKLPREQRAEARKELPQTHKVIMKILTPDQHTKYLKLLQDKKDSQRAKAAKAAAKTTDQ